MRCLFLVLLFSSVSFVKADDRLPIPDEAAQQEADELVQTVFGEQISAATKPAAKSTLTKKLLEESAAPDTSPAGRYAILKAAIDVAPDATAAMSVIDAMAKHFQIDEMGTKAYTLKKVSESAVLPHARKPLAEAAVQLADSYMAQDNFPAALALIDMALDAATKPYYSGENDLRQYGWLNANSGARTHPVGQLKPNAFGLYDLYGNVWEWCADWYAADYYAKPPVDDPTGPSAGSRRVFRGGGWDLHAGGCRSAHRGDDTPGNRHSHLGFRLASVLAEK